MSTRSILARSVGDGFTDGCYVHSDGYPTYMGAEIVKLVAIHGMAGAWEVIHAYTSRSQLDADQPANSAHDDQDYFEEWTGGVLDTDCQWAYALDVDAGTLSIFSLDASLDASPGLDYFKKTPRCVAVVRLGADEPNWVAVECGENWERCSHYAWVHFPELTQEDRRDTAAYVAQRATA